MSMKARGVMKAFKKVSVRPYIRRVYSSDPQLSFPGVRRSVGFDFSLRVPRATFLKTRKHIRKHKNIYLTTAVGGSASYVGSRAANRRRKR